MSKKNKFLAKAGIVNVNKSETELGRGKITSNFLGALVTSKLYKMQVVKAKKGKGSFQRKAKNARVESYLMVA
jgi:alternative ribosome-rescue factor